MIRKLYFLYSLHAKLFSRVVLCCMLCLGGTLSAFAQIGGIAPVKPEGAGTPDNPYLIASFQNLVWLSETPSVWKTKSHFVQTADIDASPSKTMHQDATGKFLGMRRIGGVGQVDGKPWGLLPTSKSGFNGLYNGQGYKISNLFMRWRDMTGPTHLIPADEWDWMGLFFAYEAVISDVVLESPDIAADKHPTVQVGTLIAYAFDSTIRNCRVVSPKVRSFLPKYQGGLFSGDMRFCYVYNCSVEAGDYVGEYNGGGFIGGSTGCYICGCSVSGATLLGDSDSDSYIPAIGGFVGSVGSSETASCFVDCYTDTKIIISRTHSNSAGFVGGTYGEAFFTRSLSLGDLTWEGKTVERFRWIPNGREGQKIPAVSLDPENLLGCYYRKDSQKASWNKGEEDVQGRIQGLTMAQINALGVPEGWPAEGKWFYLKGKPPYLKAGRYCRLTLESQIEGLDRLTVFGVFELSDRVSKKTLTNCSSSWSRFNSYKGLFRVGLGEQVHLLFALPKDTPFEECLLVEKAPEELRRNLRPAVKELTEANCAQWKISPDYLKAIAKPNWTCYIIPSVMISRVDNAEVVLLLNRKRSTVQYSNLMATHGKVQVFVGAKNVELHDRVSTETSIALTITPDEGYQLADAPDAIQVSNATQGADKRHWTVHGDFAITAKFEPKPQEPVVKPTPVESLPLANLHCYPNPATSRLNFEGIEAGSIVQVMNVSGTLLQAHIARCDRMQINVEKLPRGLYLLNVIPPEGNSRVLRIIIQ